MKPSPEQMTVIMRVINRLGTKYAFGFYSLDDIKQEAYIMCVEALERYDSSLPLENFLSKHLSNRLKTLRRDKYHRQNVSNEKHNELNERKKALVDLLPIHSSESPIDLSYEHDFEATLSNQQAIDEVMTKLTPSLRNDFLRMANGVPIQSYKRKAVCDAVKEILNENW